MNKRKLSCSDELLDLLWRMLCPDPTNRITTSQIKSHLWMKGTSASDQEVLDHYTKV